jgi:hypothetical protein
VKPNKLFETIAAAGVSILVDAPRTDFLACASVHPVCTE